MGIRLAPCYGATETAAMVAALPPERFLAVQQAAVTRFQMWICA